MWYPRCNPVVHLMYIRWCMVSKHSMYTKCTRQCTCPCTVRVHSRVHRQVHHKVHHGYITDVHLLAHVGYLQRYPLWYSPPNLDVPRDVHRKGTCRLTRRVHRHVHLEVLFVYTEMYNNMYTLQVHWRVHQDCCCMYMCVYHGR